MSELIPCEECVACNVCGPRFRATYGCYNVQERVKAARPAAPVDVEMVLEHLCNTCGFCPCKARNKVAGSRITHCKEYYNCHTPAKE